MIILNRIRITALLKSLRNYANLAKPSANALLVNTCVKWTFVPNGRNLELPQPEILISAKNSTMFSMNSLIQIVPMLFGAQILLTSGPRMVLYISTA